MDSLLFFHNTGESRNVGTRNSLPFFSIKHIPEIIFTVTQITHHLMMTHFIYSCHNFLSDMQYNSISVNIPIIISYFNDNCYFFHVHIYNSVINNNYIKNFIIMSINTFIYTTNQSGHASESLGYRT